MTDPAIAFLPSSGYGPYERGHILDVFLKEKNGSESLGVVWPGLNLPQSSLLCLLDIRCHCVPRLVPSYGSGVGILKTSFRY
jgi:hypothetical protein